MAERIIDAHLHVNTKDSKPLRSLISEMDEAQIEHAVLIVNSLDEMSAIKEEIELFEDNCNRFHIVAGLNIHSKEPFRIINFFHEYGYMPDIKIHPRLHGYTIDDTETLCSFIEKNCFETRNILVDAAFMGDQIDNHIGIPLSISLAKNLKNKNIIIAHTGSTKMLECQMLTRWIPNIFYDLSLSSSYLINTSVRFDMINLIRYTNNRIMYGSDYPSINMKTAIENFRTLCKEANVSNTQIESMFYYNAEKLYFGKDLEKEI